MRIGTGRVVLSLGGTMLALTLGAVGVVWATSGSPREVPRQHPGPDACRTVDRLSGVWAAGPQAVAARDDAAAARVILSAAQCRHQEQVPAERELAVHQAALRAVDWVGEHRAGAAAVHDLLDLWALAADAQAVAPTFEGAGWSRVAQRAAETLRVVLADPTLALDPAERAEAKDRLVALSLHEADHREVAVRDEREAWVMIGAALADPRAWPSLWAAPGILWDARSGAGPLREALGADADATRREATLLAATLGVGAASPRAAPDLGQGGG